MRNEELYFVINAIREIEQNHKEWGKDYNYSRRTNEFYHKDEPEDKTDTIRAWFKL
jgi:hypothetical protein